MQLKMGDFFSPRYVWTLYTSQQHFTGRDDCDLEVQWWTWHKPKNG